MNLASREYQICVNCVMDTTDSSIVFDEGVCDHCGTLGMRPNWHTDERGRSYLDGVIDEVLKLVRARVDCILGLSGGLDSSYMLHLLVQEYGLRLVFHVDGGWNSDLAVNNIQMLVDSLGLDLFTEVIDWEDMRDFQLGFFKSGISQIDIPQDHAFVATLYKFANKYGVKHIMNGGNIAGVRRNRWSGCTTAQICG